MLKTKNISKKDLGDNLASLGVSKMMNSMLSLEPRMRFELDDETYKKFDVVRLIPKYKNYYIQPILFGTKQALTLLSEYLWSLNSHQWVENMEDKTCFGTIKKRYILLPQLYKIVKRYYKKGDTIIDIGCGDGSFVKMLAEKLTKNVYGTELSDENIKILAEKFPEYKDHFYADNIIDPKNRNKKKYDIVVASFLLSNVVNIEDALNNLYKMLKKGGHLIIVDLNPYYYKALGYYYKNELVPVHNPDSIFFTEKLIDNLTKAVHAYRPWGFYRKYLKKKGLLLVNDYVLSVDRKQIELALSESGISKALRRKFRAGVLKIQITPPFYVLIMKKPIDINRK